MFVNVARYLYRLHYGTLPSKKPKRKISFEELAQIIDKLRIERSGCLFVHHSYGNLNLGFNPSKLIELLMEKVGEDGNIMMVATPFRGVGLRYLEKNSVFDVVKDSCCSGLISEIFRRKEGVFRTIHPLSSNYIWGKRAKELSLQDRNLAYPYSEDSVYGYGDRVNAKVIGLGIDVHESLTPMHYFEYLKRDVYPIYTKRKYKVKVKTSTDEFYLYTYAPNPKITRRWKNFKRAVNAERESVHFIAEDRVFYGYKFNLLKSVIFDLMEKDKYFRQI